MCVKVRMKEREYERKDDRKLIPKIRSWMELTFIFIFPYILSSTFILSFQPSS